MLTAVCCKPTGWQTAAQATTSACLETPGDAEGTMIASVTLVGDQRVPELWYAPPSTQHRVGVASQVRVDEACSHLGTCGTRVHERAGPGCLGGGGRPGARLSGAQCITITRVRPGALSPAEGMMGGRLRLTRRPTGPLRATTSTHDGCV